jgi:hypothetical protein
MHGVGELGRRALLRVIAVGLGVLLALPIGELSLRVLALFSSDVRYLARARGSQAAPRYTSLAQYLASKSDTVVPHRTSFNHWTNGLGFHDEEFVVPKPPGRFRIMAVGDSFTYGLVPYPRSAMTLLEGGLRAACPGRDLDLLNFGIVGAGVPDYRTIVELGAPTYEPDLVLLNFYVGNDGPDLYSSERESGTLRSLLPHSYFLTYTSNALRLRWSLVSSALADRTRRPAAARTMADAQPRGGQVVDPRYRLPDDDPSLVGPLFEENAFTGILGRELGRLYVPADPHDVERAWRLRLEALEATRTHVTEHGGRFVVALYPSILQVDARLRDELIDRLRARQRYSALTGADIDAALPNRVLAEYCRARDVTCFDLTATFIRTSQESPEPLYKVRDVHWTVRGNRVAAEAQVGQLAPLVCPAAGTARKR